MNRYGASHQTTAVKRTLESGDVSGVSFVTGQVSTKRIKFSESPGIIEDSSGTASVQLQTNLVGLSAPVVITTGKHLTTQTSAEQFTHADEFVSKKYVTDQIAALPPPPPAADQALNTTSHVTFATVNGVNPSLTQATVEGLGATIGGIFGPSITNIQAEDRLYLQVNNAVEGQIRCVIDDQQKFTVAPNVCQSDQPIVVRTSNNSSQLRLVDAGANSAADATGVVAVAGDLGATRVTFGATSDGIDDVGLKVHVPNQNLSLTNVDKTVQLKADGTFSVQDGDVDVTSHKVINLAEPVDDTDAATKGYVDTAVAGVDVSAIGESNIRMQANILFMNVDLPVIPGNLAYTVTGDPVLGGNFWNAFAEVPPNPTDYWQSGSTYAAVTGLPLDPTPAHPDTVAGQWVQIRLTLEARQFGESLYYKSYSANACASRLVLYGSNDEGATFTQLEDLILANADEQTIPIGIHGPYRTIRFVFPSIYPSWMNFPLYVYELRIGLPPGEKTRLFMGGLGRISDLADPAASQDAATKASSEAYTNSETLKIVDGTRAFTGAVTAPSGITMSNTGRVSSMLDPSAAQDAATKNYADSEVTKVLDGTRTFTTSKIKLDAPSTQNQLQLTDTANTTWGDAIGFTTVRGAQGGTHSVMGHYGATADENGLIVYPPNQNITLQTGSKLVRLYGSTGELRINDGALNMTNHDIINAARVLADSTAITTTLDVGGVRQDTRLSCFGQLIRSADVTPYSVSVPNTPTAPLQLVYDTPNSTYLVGVTGSTTTLTVQTTGYYRINWTVISMPSVDKIWRFYIRKNGATLVPMYLSRTGDRSTETSTSLVEYLTAGNTIDTAVQAVDGAFTLDIRYMALNLELMLINTAVP